jgi:competence protein ComEA
VSAAPAPDPRRARLRAGAGAALVLVLLGLAVAVLVTALTPRGGTTVVTASPAPGGAGEASGGTGPPAGLVYVHVVGQVARPGLYQLHDGDRVMDAIAAAGGLTPAGDPAAVNLARVLSDGEQLVVPAVGEAPPAGAAANGGAGGGVPGAKVNLNTADEATLETLPRVGPAMAQKIIDWRTKNGRFRSVQDLRGISGIGDKTFEALKDLVTV